MRWKKPYHNGNVTWSTIFSEFLRKSMLMRRQQLTPNLCIAFLCRRQVYRPAWRIPQAWKDAFEVVECRECSNLRRSEIKVFVYWWKTLFESLGWKGELLLQNRCSCKETGNINQNSVTDSLYDSSNSAPKYFELFHRLCPLRRWYLVCIFITAATAAISALWTPRYILIADDLKACN